MRTIAVLLACVATAAVATAASVVDVTVLPKPGFPPPVRSVEPSPSGPRLELVSSRYAAPSLLPPAPADAPSWAPETFRGHPLQLAARQGRRLFLVYGADALSGRYLVRADLRTRKLLEAYDFVNLARPPRGGWAEDVVWAREAGGVLYVANTHRTYATATRGRNAYLTAIDLTTRRIRWRSPALVANARTFVVSGNLIVSGYGFTAEPDFLYLLDRRSGKVLHRLAVPSAPERISLRGDRLHVRTYDRRLVVKLVR